MYRMCHVYEEHRVVRSALFALGNVAEYLPVCTGIALVGHLPGAGTAADLDALALARCYFNIVCMAPGFGYISALRTVCPQAVGAGSP